MKLPHPESTIIDDHKLTGYSLNLNHADGRHKARVFKSALNLDIDDVQFLALHNRDMNGGNQNAMP